MQRQSVINRRPALTLTLSWGASGMYVGSLSRQVWWSIPEVFVKLHQTWLYCCTSDKDQQIIYEVLDFLKEKHLHSPPPG